LQLAFFSASTLKKGLKKRIFKYKIVAANKTFSLSVCNLFFSPLIWISNKIRINSIAGHLDNFCLAYSNVMGMIFEENIIQPFWHFVMWKMKQGWKALKEVSNKRRKKIICSFTKTIVSGTANILYILHSNTKESFFNSSTNFLFNNFQIFYCKTLVRR